VGDRSCTIETGSSLCADVTVSGVGAASSECQVAPPGLNLGSIAVGSCSTTQDFVISNPTGNPLIGAVVENCPDFEVTAGGGAYILGPGQSRTVSVRFCPQSAGDKTCVVETGNGICSDVTVIGIGSVVTGAGSSRQVR
jgi:hypothetical protein